MPAQAKAGAAPARAGLTLIEMMITLAVMVVLGAMAAPSLSAIAGRQRLQSAAHQLQADVALAKLESAKQGQAVYLRFQPGAAWCYHLSTGPGGDCHQPTAGLANGVLRVVRGADHPGIALLAASTILVDQARPGALSGLQSPGQALFASREGLQLKVRVGPQSRASLCSVGLPISGTQPCPADTAEP